jgi:hypothetical protein
MENSESCRECKIIAEELAMAYTQAWDTADPATQRAWTAIRKMNTEEEVQRVEELLQGRSRRSTQSSLGFNDVVRHPENPILRVLLKKDVHECSTGHRIKLRNG